MAGKNSTPCQEIKKEGTDVILIEMDPRTSQNSSAMGSRGHTNTAINNLEVKCFAMKIASSKPLLGRERSQTFF